MHFTGKGYVAKPPQVYDRSGYKVLFLSACFRRFIGGNRKKQDGSPDNTVEVWLGCEVFGNLADKLEPDLYKGSQLVVTDGYLYTSQPRQGEQYGRLCLRVTEAVAVPPANYEPQQEPYYDQQQQPQRPAPRQAPRQAPQQRPAPRQAPQGGRPQPQRPAPRQAPRQQAAPPPAEEPYDPPPVNNAVPEDVNGDAQMHDDGPPSDPDVPF